ncbi:MAG: ATP-dependent Clp protease adapter ClpS [Cyanobacteria bacterium J06641_5]
MPAEILERPAVGTVEKTKSVRKNSPLYRVMLHNDDSVRMEHVVTVLLQTVPSLSQTQAVSIMMEAHNNGIALVIVCDLEPAEFYCETLKNHGLTSTIEPDD